MTASQLPPRKASGCSTCDAVCCRLTVVLQPEDKIPSHLTTQLPSGLHVMKHDEDGWCVAINSTKMNCGIYETRPSICRRFVMNGPYCKAVRTEYAEERALAAEQAQASVVGKVA